MGKSVRETNDNRDAVGSTGNTTAAAPAGTDARTDARRKRARTDNRTARAVAADKETASPETLGIEAQNVGGRKRSGSAVGDQAELFGSEPKQEEPKQRRQRRKTEPQKVSSTDAAQSAAMLIEMVETFAVVKFGPEAAFAPNERLLIEPSLAHIIERYGSVAQQFSWIVDPAMLILGVGLYGIRLASMLSGDNNTPPPPSQDDTPPTDDGSNGTVRGLSPDELYEMTGNALRR